MRKKQFKAESKRLLDLMINSIYTHKEIFLREIISNASDAIDKLCYLSLTDDKVGLRREDFAITLIPDEENGTLTIRDNGIGMDQEELENNLGVIAKSGTLQFRQETQGSEQAADVIGQFGVGFYSAFMVSDHITVVTRKYGSDTACRWESDGVDGYTVEPFSGFMYPMYAMISANATRPYTAMLFIEYLMTQEGFQPWGKSIGAYSTSTAVTPNEGDLDITVWKDTLVMEDPEYILDNFDDVSTFAIKYIQK